MSTAEQLDSNPFFENYWGGALIIDGVELFERSHDEKPFIESSWLGLKIVAADINRLRLPAVGEHTLFTEALSCDPQTFEPGDIINFGREYVTVVGAPTCEEAFSLLQQKLVCRKHQLGIHSSTSPYNCPDYPNGRYYAFMHEIETGFGVVLPTDGRGRQAFFAVQEKSEPIFIPRTGSFGAHTVKPSKSVKPTYEYASLQLPLHQPAAVGLATSRSNDNGRLYMGRVERVNFLSSYRPR